jgi:hypothetical protein
MTVVLQCSTIRGSSGGYVVIKRLSFLATLIVLATADLIDVHSGNAKLHHAHHSLLMQWWVLQILLYIATIFGMRTFMKKCSQSKFKPKPPRSIHDINEVPEAEAYELQRLAGGMRLTAKQARIFALAILAPAELRQRVSEHYVPAERTLTQKVTVEVKIPSRLIELKPDDGDNVESDDVDRTTLFPILLLPKGAFNDNLDVFGADNDRMSVLSYREYLQLTAGILRVFICRAYGLSSSEGLTRISQSSRSVETNVLHVEHRALTQITKRAQANIDVKKHLDPSLVSSEAEDVAKLLEDLQVDHARKVYLELAAALVRKLSMHYALVASAPIDADGRLIIQYRRTLIPELELSPDEDNDRSRLRKSIERFKGWLQALLGTRPVNVTVSLDNAWTCQSYHVRVDAPAGLYLTRQMFVTPSEYLQARAKNAPTPVHYRFRRRLGQGYAHFYGRFFPSPTSGQRRPKLKLDFEETPPGSVFRAAIASCACFGLIWLVGFVVSRTSNPNTDAPAFLLVFPGVAASWLGLDAPARLFEGTLASRLSLCLTTFTSVAASGLFIMNRSGVHLFYQTMPFGTSVLGVNKWAWALLTAISALNSIGMLYRWVNSASLFKSLAERPDPDM